MRACVDGFVCTAEGVCLRACSLSNPACHAPPLLSFATCLCPPDFLMLFYKRHDFQNVTEQKICVF